MVLSQRSTQPLAALDQVAQAIEKYRKQYVQEEGDDIETLGIMIPDAADRVELLGPAPQIKIKDLMPQGQSNQTGKINPNQIANMSTRKNCAEFFIVEDVKTEVGMSLPDKKTFDKLINTATLQLLDYNEDWVQTIEFVDVNRGGIGVLVLNQVAADMVREYIVKQSTLLVAYQTYPIGDMMKRYADTAFIHAGKNTKKNLQTKLSNTNSYLPPPSFSYLTILKLNYPLSSKEKTTNINLPIYSTDFEFLPSAKIGSIIKKCNPDIKGTFTIVDCRTLTEVGKTGCRIVSIEGSLEFMDYLASTPKQKQFKMLHKKVYLNSGKRADSTSEYSTPKLTHAALALFVKGVNDLIMKSASKMYGAMKAYPDKYVKSNKNTIIKLNSYKLKLTSPLAPTDRITDLIMDEADGSTDAVPRRRPKMQRNLEKRKKERKKEIKKEKKER